MEPFPSEKVKLSVVSCGTVGKNTRPDASTWAVIGCTAVVSACFCASVSVVAVPAFVSAVCWVLSDVSLLLFN